MNSSVGRSFGYFRALRFALAAAPMAVAAACGGGGGSGGGGSPEIQVLEDVPFLLSDGGSDPRTGERIQFILREITNPEDPLTADDIEVRRNGVVDVEARVRVNPPDIEKSDITLILDVSSSLTPADLEDVKASAVEFADDMLPLASTLRIYYFSSPSETLLLGSYESIADEGSFFWQPDPAPDIEGIPGGANSTALFLAVRTALDDDTENDDILVVFSDGQENSSPEGAREDVLTRIEDDRVVVFSVGFGSVDSEDLRALSRPYGAFLGVKPSLVGLFDEVARQIQSIYTVVYDTPTSFGTQTLELKIDVDRKTLRYKTTFEAGIDLAQSAYGRYPTLPGSVIELVDYTREPAATLTYTVLGTDAAIEGENSLYAFAVEPTHACPGPGCMLAYQGPYGQGAQSETGATYMPAELVVGSTWVDPVSGGEFMFMGFEKIEVLRGTPDKMRLECARVGFEGGTHWFAPQIGLVRTENFDGDILLDLATAPCLSDGFDGGCTVR